MGGKISLSCLLLLAFLYYFVFSLATSANLVEWFIYIFSLVAHSNPSFKRIPSHSNHSVMVFALHKRTQSCNVASGTASVALKAFQSSFLNILLCYWKIFAQKQRKKYVLVSTGGSWNCFHRCRRWYYALGCFGTWENRMRPSSFLCTTCLI